MPTNRLRLIAAYLEESNAGFWTWFEQASGSPNDPARDRLVALFTALHNPHSLTSLLPSLFSYNLT
jgi:hypothetical protein